MTPDDPDPAIDEIPTLDEVGPYYDGLLELATELLDAPVSTRIRTWEDGEFEIRVFHGDGPYVHRPGVSYQQVLRYHSRDDVAEKGLFAIDTETEEKTLIYRRSIATDGVFADADRIP